MNFFYSKASEAKIFTRVRRRYLMSFAGHFGKAFVGVDRETLWKILRHRGIPEKLINVIICQYTYLICRAIHGGELTEPFRVKTGMLQGCMLSPFLLPLIIDVVTRQSMVGKETGIHWISGRRLEYLEYADDLVLMSFSFDDIQEKTRCLEKVAATATVSYS